MVVPAALPAHSRETQPQRSRVPRLPLPAQLQYAREGKNNRWTLVREGYLDACLYSECRARFHSQVLFFFNNTYLSSSLSAYIDLLLGTGPLECSRIIKFCTSEYF